MTPKPIDRINMSAGVQAHHQTGAPIEHNHDFYRLRFLGARLIQ
jgi:hypothetical protein